jgi:hypothetical protein
MPLYTTSCHCGGVRFEVIADIDHVRVCDCSIRRGRGTLNYRVPRENLRLLTGWESLTLYEWGSRTVKDYFRHADPCIPTYWQSVPQELRGGAAPFDEWAVNVRCLDGLDLDSIPIERIFGSEIDYSA